MTQYVYDADGNRIGKGSISTFSCDQTTNGLQHSNNCVVGLGGEQLDEYDGTASNLLHSNVFSGGRLLATYSNSAWTYAFNDWLGTKRVQISPDGVTNHSTFASFPFGDGLSITGTDATEQHFTGDPSRAALSGPAILERWIQRLEKRPSGNNAWPSFIA